MLGFMVRVGLKFRYMVSVYDRVMSLHDDR